MELQILQQISCGNANTILLFACINTLYAEVHLATSDVPALQLGGAPEHSPPPASLQDAPATCTAPAFHARIRPNYNCAVTATASMTGDARVLLPQLALCAAAVGGSAKAMSLPCGPVTLHC